MSNSSTIEARLDAVLAQLSELQSDIKLRDKDSEFLERRVSDLESRVSSLRTEMDIWKETSVLVNYKMSLVTGLAKFISGAVVLIIIERIAAWTLGGALG